jgi:hypothetical protein
MKSEELLDNQRERERERKTVYERERERKWRENVRELIEQSVKAIFIL